ncbi:hypothetical protein IW140_003476 [Coemansia sp. RSA 1813]|nr:hypothetical protein EV178_000877 [Coemansia sp. RSA 1646]KAJ1769605.1 hypothetical protein LPJ74_003916 [Coemansia sp. RSA 1843]KAJ2088455.1 hypothetical protein IW138_004233 [Coemansia sp. RSA 986]KAJ2213549.1 hypothetical protein EV179_003774 [Coemansia sp. RSA 487]KAJ2568970.1 hypothetical protein IW140_003476 [Coemansia sp. RSA 1813]
MSSKGSKARNVGKEFLCKVRYKNPLPEVPFPPKLLPIPPTYVDPNAGSYSQSRLHHYVQYRHTTLEEATPYPIIVDADYGMPIDPCLLGAFDEDRGASLLAGAEIDERDRFLLNLPSTSNGATAEAGVAAAAAESNVQSDGVATPVSQHSGHGVKQPGVSRTAGGAKRMFDHSIEGQLRTIEESFACFSKYDNNPDGGEQELLRSLRHPTDSKLRAVESYPLFPDEDLWSNIYTAFLMDTCADPEFLVEKREKINADEYKRAADLARDSLVFRPRVRQNHLGEDEQWIECFLPEDEATAHRARSRMLSNAPFNKASDQDVEYRFEKAREYDMPIRPDAATRQDLYMITIDTANDGSSGSRPVAKYVPIKSKVLLKHRQPMLSRMHEQGELDDPLRITSLDLQLRDFSEEETQERAAARNKLHEIIKEEIVHTSGDSPRNGDGDDENIDVGGGLFDDDYEDSGANRNAKRHRRTPSYSPSP